MIFNFSLAPAPRPFWPGRVGNQTYTPRYNHRGIFVSGRKSITAVVWRKSLRKEGCARIFQWIWFIAADPGGRVHETNESGEWGGADGKETFFEKFINDDESVISVGFCSTTWTVLTSSYRLPGLASRQTVTRFQVVYTNEPLVSPLWCVVFFYGFLGFQHLVQRLQYFNRITERTL